MDYIGSTDSVTWRSVRGWAYSPDNPNLPVDVFAGDEKIGTAIAGEFRVDLKNAGIGDGRHAFYYEIPPEKRGREIRCQVGDFIVPQPSPETGDEYVRWRARRRARLLSRLPLGKERGLEFGPLHDPLVPPNTFNIKYVDHASTEDLCKKYEHDAAVDAREIVPVDFVWLDKPLRDSIFPFTAIGYAVALHVAEHVPDLIGWMLQIRSAIRKGGILALALPDKRYCFDYRRKSSKVSELIGAYARSEKRPTPGMIYDSRSNAVSHNGAIAWYTWQTPPRDEDLKFVHTKQEAFATAAAAQNSGEYLDAHCWVFTPETFAETMGELKAIGLFPFNISELHGPDGHEFIAILEAE